MKNDTATLAVPMSLRERRKLRGWTLAELANEIGLSTTAVHNLESGKNGFTDKTLAALAKALQCRPADLLLPVEGDKKVEGEAAVKKLLRQIEGLPEEAVNPIWRVISGFLEDAE